MRASRRWFQRRTTWLIAGLLGLILWYATPSTYHAGNIRFTFRSGDTPGVLTFLVHDGRGQPLPGVHVMSESFSGTTNEVMTDASGVATISPGEEEVLAVYIEGHEFRLRYRNLILENFGPDCDSGLTFNVTIGSDR